MNYSDLLPNDITKIINRKVQDLHIIKRGKNEKKIEKLIENKNKKQIEKDIFMKNM